MFYRDIYRRCGDVGKFDVLKLIRSDPAFRFVLLFRLIGSLKEGGVLKFIVGFFYRIHKNKYGLQIPEKTIIGEGLLLPHFGGIVINSKATIGNDCTIMQGVTIGSIKTGKRSGVPVVGNSVYIGPNAVVVGGVTIGDGATIAPGAFVNIDVPPNSLAIGNPAKIIKR